jgi:hypothetical protein
MSSCKQSCPNGRSSRPQTKLYLLLLLQRRLQMLALYLLLLLPPQMLALYLLLLLPPPQLLALYLLHTR